MFFTVKALRDMGHYPREGIWNFSNHLLVVSVVGLVFQVIMPSSQDLFVLINWVLTLRSFSFLLSPTFSVLTQLNTSLGRKLIKSWKQEENVSLGPRGLRCGEH